jgi:hypothetical protein
MSFEYLATQHRVEESLSRYRHGDNAMRTCRRTAVIAGHTTLKPKGGVYGIGVPARSVPLSRYLSSRSNGSRREIQTCTRSVTRL